MDGAPDALKRTSITHARPSGAGHSRTRFRVSSGFLWRSVIVVVSAALDVLLALDSYRAWRAVGTADRLASIAEASSLGFRAMHNMRVIRSYTVRALKDANPIAAAQQGTLSQSHQVAGEALRAMPAVLPRLDFAAGLSGRRSA
jgi:hypothetical protein